MSHNYKIEVEVEVAKEDRTVLRQGEVAKIRKTLEDWGFHPDDDECCDQIDRWFVTFWGERSLGGRSPDDAHAELEKILPGVVTKWRCIDYDDWDEILGKSEEESEEPAVLES